MRVRKRETVPCQVQQHVGASGQRNLVAILGGSESRHRTFCAEDGKWNSKNKNEIELSKKKWN